MQKKVNTDIMLIERKGLSENAFCLFICSFSIFSPDVTVTNIIILMAITTFINTNCESTDYLLVARRVLGLFKRKMELM